MTVADVKGVYLAFLGRIIASKLYITQAQLELSYIPSTHDVVCGEKLAFVRLARNLRLALLYEQQSHPDDKYP